MEAFKVEVKVRGGFPVVVRGYVHAPQYSIGEYQRFIEDYEVLTTKGKSASFLNLSAAELNQLMDDVWWELRD